MAATLGYGRADLVEAAREQGARLAYVHNELLTNPAQERLARELVEVAPEGFTRAHFVTGGAEANEAALRLARHYHVDRGEPRALAGDLARAELPRADDRHPGADGPARAPGPARPVLPAGVPPHPTERPSASTRPGRPRSRLSTALWRKPARRPSRRSSASRSARAALPAHKPPDRFWEGLAERRERHGFLICFDEIVTGLGRTGSWFAANDLPFVPDIIATAKGLGAGLHRDRRRPLS